MDHIAIGVFEDGDNTMHGFNYNGKYAFYIVALFIDRKKNMEKVNKLVNGTAKAYFTISDMNTFPILIREIMGIYR